jgi:hypothetical protein
MGFTKAPEQKIIGKMRDFTKDTVSRRSYNLGIPENGPNKIFEEEVVYSGPTFIDTIKEHFSNISWAFTNPKEFISILISSTFKYTANLAWTFLKRNMWIILGTLTLKMIAYKAYTVYLNKRNSEAIFRNIKDRLRIIYDAGKHFEGVTEEEIIRNYSKDYNLSEDHFRNNIMPRLKHMRQKDGEIKEFETDYCGRNKIAWQYSGYGY